MIEYSQTRWKYYLSERHGTYYGKERTERTHKTKKQVQHVAELLLHGQAGRENKRKKVPILCTLTALLAVAINLTEITITPAIIGAVEIHAPLPRLFAVIAGFVLCACC